MSAATLTRSRVEPPSGMARYLDDIHAARELLSPADGVTLARGIKAGQIARDHHSRGDFLLGDADELEEIARIGEETFRHLVESNLRLVISIVRPRAKWVEPARFADLVRAGNVGLLHSAMCFDYAKGYKFSTYATWWIRKHIDDGRRTMRGIRLGHNLNLKLRQISQIKHDLTSELGRPPSKAEIAEELDLTIDQLTKFERISAEPVSLNVALEAGSELGELIPDDRLSQLDQALVGAESHRLVERVLTALDDDERTVVRLLYGFAPGGAFSRQEIATHMGLPAGRIGRLKWRALGKLRRCAELGELDERRYGT